MCVCGRMCVCFFLIWTKLFFCINGAILRQVLQKRGKNQGCRVIAASAVCIREACDCYSVVGDICTDIYLRLCMFLKKKKQQVIYSKIYSVINTKNSITHQIWFLAYVINQGCSMGRSWVTSRSQREHLLD